MAIALRMLAACAALAGVMLAQTTGKLPATGKPRIEAAMDGSQALSRIREASPDRVSLPHAPHLPAGFTSVLAMFILRLEAW